MKTNSIIPRLFYALCFICTTSAVFGQTVYTWTGVSSGGDGTNLAAAANWTPTGGPPSGATQDTGQWDGQVAGSLGITYISGLPSTGFGTSGINLNLTANQTSPVTIIDPSGNSGTIGLFGINVASGAAAFTLGDNTANQLNIIGRPAGSVHALVNSSANPVTINGSVRWQAGGGSAYVLDFNPGPATGSWVVYNYLRNDNGSGPTTIALEGGTMTWYSESVVPRGNSATGPVQLLGGTMIIKSSGLLPFENPGTVPSGNNTIVNNGTLLEFDAPAQSDNIARVISGSSPLQVNNGTWTFSGQNTYSGNTILTGGELIAGTTESAGSYGPLGEGGTVSFTGGTLGWSGANTYDYSATFSTAAGQAYSFDTGGQFVTLATGLGSSGGTLAKTGPGTLTLSGASTYGGATTVSAGKLAFQGSKSGSGSISLADGAALDVTATGTQVTPGTLAVGTSAGATLEFDNVSSTTVAPVAVGTLSSAGPVNVNINTGTFTPGQSYPLLTWTTGSTPTVALGTLNGFIGNLSFAGNKLLLNITATAYKWTGANNGSWDITTANNWLQNGSPVVFANGGPALFDDTATGPTSVAINGVVQPTSVTVNNSSKTYSIASSSGNDLGGSSTLTKSGSGTLTLSGGANAYTGVTTVSGGILSAGTVANGGSASDIGAAANSAGNLVLNGGTLQYTGGAAASDHLFSLGTSGGTIDASGSGALNLNNTGPVGLPGTGARVFTLTGSDTIGDTLAAVLADSAGGGATALIKNGTGTWILTGTNTESGATTISAGTLQIGGGGASGAIGTGSIVNNSVLNFNRTGSLLVNGAISGSGTVTNIGSGTVILAGNNTYTGGTTVNAGTLQFGNGGATGSFDPGAGITDNGTLAINTTGTFTYNGTIDGTGQFIKQGSGLVKLLGTETYTGGTTIAAGAALQISQGNQGTFAAIGSFIDNGSLIIGRQDSGVFGITNNITGTGSLTREINNTQGGGDITLMGTNTYSGGTFINGGEIILGDGATPGAGSIVGNVTFAVSPVGDGSRFFEFNRPDDLTFPGVIGGIPTGSSGATQGVVVQNGPNTVTLTGANTYAGGTTINAGTLVVGNGGTSGTIGTGPVDDESLLVFNLSGNLTFLGAISGAGSVVQGGSGTLTLTGANTITGPTTVSNGTLVASSAGGDLDVEGGTLVTGGAGTVATFSVGGNMNIDSGTVLVSLNKSLSPSNTTFTAVGAVNSTGGTLKLLNYGPSLVVGDKFNIFGLAVTGSALTIVSPGYTFANNLAVDGSVTVTAVAQPATVTGTVSGGNLNLSWPAAYTGLYLQGQTNKVSMGLSTNWVTIPGTAAGNSYSIPVGLTNGSVFYRLSPL